jgi:hypothetical protein
MYAFLNHLSIGYNIGAAYSQAYFRGDSASLTTKKIDFQRYTYLTVPFKLKFIFSTGNQNNDNRWPGMLLEMGAVYNMPVLCREVVRYNNQKTIYQNLHQFTDVRAYAGIGFYPVEVYAEYRFFDFMRGAYPEMPKLRFGLKIIFGDYW